MPTIAVALLLLSTAAILSYRFQSAFTIAFLSSFIAADHPCYRPSLPLISRRLPLFPATAASSYASSPWPIAYNRTLLIFFPLPQPYLPQPTL
ncbi:hypothetical protein B296_00020456 [Ensete ventricosum]|uniref:Secreted protein n=1 Tax=Ensete ventricosum TaxID=4639 RepID=A0A426XU02_ENSVE|nr:hypothetical protein B296_00020456 [Ensete ventricosum]